MAWLLFMDESGHDHKHAPLEVRGGVAIHTSKLWGFVRGWEHLERDSFGVLLSAYGKEGKGSKLLDRDRMKWAEQNLLLAGDDRRKHCRSFLEKGREKKSPSAIEFAAYGQACLELTRGVFELLIQHEAKLFAAAIPRGTKPPAGFAQVDYLRKDHVFLFERFFYFLEEKHEHGLLIMDESDKTDDRRFVSRMRDYFTKTQVGRQRSYWIIPAPLFVSSEMSYAIQAADICMYCINWGFRLPSWKNVEPPRLDVTAEFSQWIGRLQWTGQGYREDKTYMSSGIVLVNDPYTARQ